ncbi:M13 family metallopeptidase [Aerococcaceae bacterium zg-B36]|uniref:M13-type metalloendopeptidase n=1 Tax=Aerococcaceae bacterium zg-252 TaxID=2796928 RepID=UPI001BD89FCB|nr:M13 family metallopeptidase [Aerococcaceae bacterium zg-B36]
MKRNKKIALLLASTLLLSTVSSSFLVDGLLVRAEETTAVEESNAESLSPKTDLYQFVNAEWLAQATIKADSLSVDSFSEIQDKVEETLKEDVKKIVAGEIQLPDTYHQNFVNLYQIVNNVERRNEEGAAPAKPYLDKIASIASVDDLRNYIINESSNFALPAPITFGIINNPKKSDEQMFAVGQPSLLLPAKDYYADETQKAQLFDLLTQTTIPVLVGMGYSEEEAATLMEQAIAFDALLVPYARTSAESADITTQINERSLEELGGYSESLKLNELVTTILGTEDVEHLIVTHPEYYEAINDVVNEENLGLIKSWMMVLTARELASFLSEELYTANQQYTMALTGVQEFSTGEDLAFDVATANYDEVIGQYYGQTYFGEEARQQVTEMVTNIIAVYRERLAKNDWLSQATIDGAIKKLDNLSVNIGYPDKISDVYDLLSFDTEKSWLENVMENRRVRNEYAIEHYSEPVDKSLWGMGAQTVNAFYSPLSNGIYFPAAFLQAPFYSIEQTPSQNYGGIGAVIAHEISHAFDTNGALFDENGNMNNWWTEEDFAKFEEKTQAFVTQWSGLEVAGNPVNAELTLTENIADAGGISASLEALMKQEGADAKEFFFSWARNWRQNIRPEALAMIMATDEHAPNPLRANMQVRNLDLFHEVFETKEGDAMYLAPEERISLW